MPETGNIIKFIKRFKRPYFTTRELSDVSQKAASVVTQSLNFLRKQGVVIKIYRGVWAEVTNKALSPYAVLPYLFKSNRVYISFLSALHMHGIIEQIPQVITLASTSHTKKIKTSIGTYSVHKISPKFFFGFNWYKNTENFLVAEPEKALADCLYLFTRKKKQYGYFPELNLQKPFNVEKVRSYILKIPDKNARLMAESRLKEILKENKTNLS
jgi:predicted transcriptional regulator of viral defense system